MASTKLIAEEHATGKTKNIYEEIKSRLEIPGGPKHAGFGDLQILWQTLGADASGGPHGNALQSRPGGGAKIQESHAIARNRLKEVLPMGPLDGLNPGTETFQPLDTSVKPNL